jgi:hypothetical protein
MSSKHAMRKRAAKRCNMAWHDSVNSSRSMTRRVGECWYRGSNPIYDLTENGPKKIVPGIPWVKIDS